MGELFWADFFAKHNLKTLVVAYDDLRDHLRPALSRVLSYLGLPDTSAELGAPPLRPLADQQSTELRQALLEYLQGGHDFRL